MFKFLLPSIKLHKSKKHEFIEWIWLTWNLVGISKAKKTCNLMVEYFYKKLNIKLLNNVILLVKSSKKKKRNKLLVFGWFLVVRLVRKQYISKKMGNILIIEIMSSFLESHTSRNAKISLNSNVTSYAVMFRMFNELRLTLLSHVKLLTTTG